MQNVTCVELRMDAATVDEETFSQLMQAFSALGGSEETAPDGSNAVRIAWFEPAEVIEEQVQKLHAAASLIGAEAGQYSIEVLSDDWETAWQKNWQAMHIGQQMCVRPSFCEALPDCAVDIVLDPGMAFGTGTHPTTFLCLEAIETYCQSQAPKSVLDMGAGSGLLAIAAGKMGATNIDAIDYDPISVEATEVNAAINQVELTSILGDTPPNKRYEMVVANILAGPLLDMSQGLADCVDSHLILSGLLNEQVPAIIKAYEKAGLKHLRTLSKEEWSAVEFIR